MRRFLILLAVFIAGTHSFGQDNSFFRRYNLSGMQGGLHLEKTTDGGFVATGQHQDNSSAGGCDIYIYDVDKCGNTLWLKLYGSGGSDGGKTIRETSDGGFIVTGHYQDSQGFLMRVNEDGNLLWHRSYSGLDWTFYASQTADGGFIATGKNASASVFFRTDSDGNVLWARRITGIGEFPFFIEETSDGNFYFTSSYNIPGRDICAGKLNAAGDLLWCKGYGAGWSDSDHTSWSCRGVIDEPDGSLIVTSPIVSQGSGGDDVLLMKVSLTDGSMIWSKAIGGPGSDQSRDIEITEEGYAIIGNTNSSPFSASQFPQTMSADMSERDVLLIYVDHDGNEIWSRTYGATGRDKGIGVRFNQDRSFTLSAYTSSPFFGVFDGSFDPLFIKTDTLGIVNCQTGFPTLNFNTVTLGTADLGSSQPHSLSSTANSPTVNSYFPNDTYICQSCITVPEFVPSDTMICVGETLELYNTTTIGLTCFQEWNINGEFFPGYLDTLSYVFTEPGTFTVELFSTCGLQSSTFTLEIHVYEVELGAISTSNFNGFEVSCPGANDGWINTSASGGYFSGTAQYTVNWTGTQESGFLAEGLIAGTYSVTAADEIGCSATQSILIEEPVPMALSLAINSDYNGTPISCYQASDGSLSGTLTGGIAAYSYSWTGSGNYSGLQANALSAGSYSLTVQDANSCTVTSSISLTEPGPVVSQIAITSDYNGFPISCAGFANGAMAMTSATGGTVSTPGAYAYQWHTVPAGCADLSCMQPVPGATVPQLANLSAGNYALVTTDLNGCSFSTMQAIAAPPALVPSIAITSNYNGYSVSCFGASDGSAAAAANGGVPGYTFEWSTGATGSILDGLPIGTFSVQATDLNNCSASAEVVLTQPDFLSVEVLVLSEYNGAMISCHDAEDGILDAQGTGGVIPYNTLWSDGQTAQEAEGLGPGTYSVQLTDANGCLATDSAILTPPTPVTPQLNIISDYNGFDVSCFGAMDGEAEATANGGTGSYTFNWEGNLGSAGTGTPVTIGAGQVELTVSDVNGCEATINSVASTPPPLVASSVILSNYNGYPVSCFGLSDASFEVVPSGGVSPYLITSSDITVITSNNSGLAENAGAGTYGLVVTDSNNCTTPIVVAIIEPTPVVLTSEIISNYNGAMISCTGASDGQGAVYPEGGIQPYSISWPDGSSSLESQSNLAAGDVLVTLTDANGCAAAITLTLEDPSPVELSILSLSDYNGYQIRCNGGTDGSIEANAIGGTGALTYSWNGEPSSASPAQLTAGTYFIVTTDLNGCQDTATVVLNEPNPLDCEVLILSDYNGYKVSCSGSNDGEAIVNSTGGVGAHSYMWSNGGSAALNDQLAIQDSWVQISDLNDCITECLFALNEPAPLQADFLLIPDTCNKQVGRIAAYPSGGVSPYSCTWLQNPDGELNVTGNEITQLLAGSYVMSLEDANDCAVQFTLELDNLPAAVLSMRISPSPACAEEVVNFSGIADNTLLSWDWSFGDGSFSNSSDPAHIYAQSGSYPVTLAVFDQLGCELRASGTAIVMPQMSVFVPNSFTPNNDGMNDAFGAIGEGMETFYLVILDRWGNVVFETTDPEKLWDGRYQDGQHYVQADNYVYRLIVSSPCTPEEEFTGSVVVIR